NDSFTMRSQFYGYDATREWFTSDIMAFNANTGLVDRQRLLVDHDQKQFGNNTDLIWNNRIAGMDNRTVIALEFSSLDFTRPAFANIIRDSVALVDPVRGLYGAPLTQGVQTAKIDNVALSLEDRLKLTPTFALIGGVRLEE